MNRSTGAVIEPVRRHTVNDDTENREVHHDDDFMTVYWPSQSSFPIVVWKKFSATGGCRPAFEKVLSLIPEKRVVMAMADFTSLSVLSTDDQIWIRTDWLPRASRAGLRHLGVVLPEKPLGKASLLKGIRVEDASRLEIAYFNAQSQTQDWLQRLTVSSDRS